MPNKEKKYNGFLIDTHVVKDAASKLSAQDELFGWKYVELTAREWIAHLQAGHTIQPSTFAHDPETGRYRHLKELWQHTYFILADADHIRGVEFTDAGVEKNPNGVAPFTSETELYELYPTLSAKVYAVTQSVSSMYKDPPHRRYRLIFLFDEPITSEAHYHQILLALSAEFPIIPPVERSPAQPVFGNAREGYNHAAMHGSTLKPSDYPYQETENTEDKAEGATTDTSEAETALKKVLEDNDIPYTIRKKGGFYVRCPYSEFHTGGLCGPTDAYVSIGTEGVYTGKFAFLCSHDSCKMAGRRTWAAFKAGYGIKSSHRTYTAKQRLFIKTDAQHIKTDAMDTIRTLLKNEVLDWLLKVYDAEKKQILIVNTGTATGKSHVIIATIENLIMLNPTKELAEEAYNKAVMDFGKNAVLHLSRWHNWDKYRDYLDNPLRNRHDLKINKRDLEGVICAYPDRCDRLFLKGHSAREKLCETKCDRRGECKNHGYLSQFRIYQDTTQTQLQVYTAQPQNATIDAELKETIQAYGLNRDGTVLVVDEADPIKMIPTRQINYEDWRAAAAFYNGTSAGVFFEKLLQETATVPNRVTAADPEEYIQQINENGLAFRDALKRAFDAFEQYVAQYDQTLTDGLKIVQAQMDEVATWDLDRIPVDNPNIAQLYDGHPAKIDAQIENLADNHTTLIDNLQGFLDSSADSETPPVRNIAQGIWEFALPPTLNAKKNIYLTASNTAELIRKQMRNVDADMTQTDNTIAPWKPGCKLYQINTGRYTPRSLFTNDALTPRGKEIIGLIIATLEDGKDTLIVAPGAFCEEGILYHDPLIQQLHALPHSHIATHQHAIGVNKYSELPRAIVIHYEPHISELLFVSKAIYPNETLSYEREQVTLQNHGLILQDVWRYKDKSVQQVYDTMCANPIMQSENRIRPQLYKNKEIWRLSAEPIPAPATPILFSIPDWQAYLETDRTETFDQFLQARNNRNAKQVAEDDNVSPRTAYRKTENTRKENKAVRDAEIIRLHNEGHKQSDIAMHCNVSERTVIRVLAKQKKK